MRGCCTENEQIMGPQEELSLVKQAQFKSFAIKTNKTPIIAQLLLDSASSSSANSALVMEKKNNTSKRMLLQK